MVYNGLFLYNACLLGTVIPALYEPLYGGTNDYNMWIMLIIISSMRLAHSKHQKSKSCQVQSDQVSYIVSRSKSAPPGCSPE